MMKTHAKESLLICCLMGLGAGPALGARMMLLPAGVQPGEVTTRPYTHTVAAGGVVEVDVWIAGTAPDPVGGWQVQMPCTAAGGSGGSIDFTSRLLDEDRLDYVFTERPTLGPGGNDGKCPGAGIPPGDIYTQSPMVGTMMLDGMQPVVTDPLYLCTFAYRVSADAAGLFTLDPICYPNGPDLSCPTLFTYVAAWGPRIIPADVDPLLINVARGDPCPQGAVTFNDPPDGVVDARQPHPVNSLEPKQGITTVEVSAPAGADTGCWSLCENPRRASPNHIASVVDHRDGSYSISFSRPITPGAVTTLTYTPNKGPAVTARFRAHPANVNGDGSTSPADLLHVINYLNGVATPPWGLYSTDINHDGRFGSPDVLRVIDLLNGAGAFEEWNRTERPADDSPCP